MSFDICEQKMRTLIIKAGIEIRKLKGLPEEKNITVIYNETAPLLGIAPIQFTSDKMDHLPTPGESVRENPKLAQICPKCGERTYYVRDLCRGCKEAEGGKYKTKLECFKCHYTERSEEPSVVWLGRWKIDFGMQTKASLGIKTVTDEGIK